MSPLLSNKVADTFFDRFGILPKESSQDFLWEIGEAFSHLPFENLTKLLKKHRGLPNAEWRRMPDEVLADHLSLGTGGTCFALTNFFQTVLRTAGYYCRPVMCDMRNEKNVHCAVIIQLKQSLLLMDPGFLLHQPILLQPGRTSECNTGVADVRLVGDPTGKTYELFTGDTWRYRMKIAEVPPEKFLSFWDASFNWGMMNGIHLSRAVDGGYTYVHGNKLRLQKRQTKENLNIRGIEEQVIAERFGIDPKVVKQAYALVKGIRQNSPKTAESSNE
ncbi:MAG: arylamine N-acetyltransferase [Pseudomonadota bacterium]